MPGSHAGAVAGAGSGRVALVEAVFRPFGAKSAVQYYNVSFAHGPHRRSSHVTGDDGRVLPTAETQILTL